MGWVGNLAECDTPIPRLGLGIGVVRGTHTDEGGKHA